MLLAQCLHDRAGTFASLLYKNEKPSVCPHFFRYDGCSVVSTRIDARYARYEAPVFADHEEHF